MQLIKVKTENSSYSIHVEKGLFENVPVMLEPFNHGQTWVIFTHPILNDLYGKKLAEILQSAGFISITITMPEGEQSKTIGQVNDLYEQLLSHNCDRSTTFIALGGGVVGDVTGFVASTFMRGVDYIQIPTTLLAMVDSSVGGKTGVNLPRGKNLVGTFYQPRLVLIDPNLLHSLPLRDIVAGLAEVLKYGAIHNKDFFIKTAENLQLLSSLVSEAPITETIAESCRIKAQIVSEDEKETGLRRILNFGHTIGHALEIGNTRPVLRHGEAVAYGMLCAGYLSFINGMIDDKDWALLEKTLRELPIPQINFADPENILNLMKHDKKREIDTLNFVMLRGLGRAEIIQDLPEDQIVEAIHSVLMPWRE